jgi:hypothetical protein
VEEAEIQESLVIRILRNKIKKFIKVYKKRPTVIILPYNYQYKKNMIKDTERIRRKYEILFSSNIHTATPMLHNLEDPLVIGDEKLPF